jgi:hypothetical protein
MEIFIMLFWAHPAASNLRFAAAGPGFPLQFLVPGSGTTATGSAWGQTLPPYLVPGSGSSSSDPGTAGFPLQSLARSRGEPFFPSMITVNRRAFPKTRLVLGKPQAVCGSMRLPRQSLTDTGETVYKQDEG